MLLSCGMEPTAQIDGGFLPKPVVLRCPAGEGNVAVGMLGHSLGKREWAKSGSVWGWERSWWQQWLPRYYRLTCRRYRSKEANWRPGSWVLGYLCVLDECVTKFILVLGIPGHLYPVFWCPGYLNMHLLGHSIHAHIYIYLGHTNVQDI